MRAGRWPLIITKSRARPSSRSRDLLRLLAATLQERLCFRIMMPESPEGDEGPVSGTRRDSIESRVPEDGEPTQRETRKMKRKMSMERKKKPKAAAAAPATAGGRH